MESSKQITITCSFIEDDLEVSWKVTFTAELNVDKEDNDGKENEE